ncbi:MAG: VWA domain-containing protein [Chloracidobacterium sp.]|uniref:VWA domain-containing protein n=1 Tax=Chloracidobacterium validum TaxID=2821543 RepID=A0ABX8B844_9BACT|nr:VWA domain-containing protein [Chloracidobacterium validum]QUW02836.1 VWA domain-containing protein [Chloracidobacterium validum]
MAGWAASTRDLLRSPTTTTRWQVALRCAVMAWWLLVGCTLDALAQERPGVPDDTLVTLRAQQVIVPFTVVDRSNRPVTDLAAEEVKLFEDGVEQEIVSLQPAPTLPITAALVLDCSGSMVRRLPLAKRATSGFLARLLRLPQDRAALLACQQDILLAQPLTGELSALQASLSTLDERLPSPLGRIAPFDPANVAPPGTALYAAIYAAIDTLLSSDTSDGRRRIVVVISDGFDSEGLVRLGEVIERAWRGGVSIYALGIGQPELNAADTSRTVNRAELERLCAATGGQAFFPRLDREFFTAFEQIDTDLRQCFVLAYTPTNESAAFRAIRIEISRHPDWKVRHRAGYYANANE